MDRGAGWATVNGVAKESDMTEQLTLFIFFFMTVRTNKNVFGKGLEMKKKIKNDTNYIRVHGPECTLLSSPPPPHLLSFP